MGQSTGYVVNTLRTAKRIISKSTKWVQNAEAESKDGSDVKADNPAACRFCAGGAVCAAVGTGDWFHPEVIRTRGYLERTIPVNAQRIGQTDIPDYNDAPRRRHAHVLRWFDRAIALAKQEGV